MRRPLTILAATMAAAMVLPEIAQARVSPQGIIGGITRPFRQILGHLGQVPRRHHRPAGTTAAVAAAGTAGAAIAATPSSERPASAKSRLGWAGPPGWSSAYEDILGFAFWPDEYASRLRDHGFDVIADTISGRFDKPRTTVRAAAPSAAVKDDADNDSFVGQCGETSKASDDWPSTRVKQMVQLSDAQTDALQKLQISVSESAKTINAGCGQPRALTPPERLDALVQALWAVRDAGISAREPLNSFYDTLTSTQKNSFASFQAQNASLPDSKAANTKTNKMQVCVSQNAEKAERWIKEIEMRVRPNSEQAASLETLHKAASDMAKLLIASCTQPIPTEPAARLDAAADQVTAMNYAATTVQIAFDNFYADLDNEQKARFVSSGR